MNEDIKERWIVHWQLIVWFRTNRDLIMQQEINVRIHTATFLDESTPSLCLPNLPLSFLEKSLSQLFVFLLNHYLFLVFLFFPQVVHLYLLQHKTRPQTPVQKENSCTAQTINLQNSPKRAVHASPCLKLLKLTIHILQRSVF